MARSTKKKRINNKNVHKKRKKKPHTSIHKKIWLPFKLLISHTEKINNNHCKLSLYGSIDRSKVRSGLIPPPPFHFVLHVTVCEYQILHEMKL